jgi:hypothetical protein
VREPLTEEIRSGVPDPASPEWEPIEVDVDGHAHRFRRFEREDQWVAGCRAGDLWLTIDAGRLDATGLRRVWVTDPTPYLDGARRFQLI